MQYQGKLFGKVGKAYFPLELTTTDVDKLQEEIEKLKSANIKLRNCENCKHEFHPFIEGTPCLGCCSEEHEFLNWEGKK
jgi:hypothetical protein